MSNYNDDDDGGASQTQTAVIEETIGSMMRAMMAVHNDRSGGSQSDQHDVRVSPSNHRRLQMRLLASLDFLAPYRDHSERDWDELGPDGWTPEMIRQRVREGETVTVVPDDEFNPEPREVQQPTRVDIRVLEQTARDMLELAEELGFYPEPDAKRQPLIAEAV